MSDNIAAKKMFIQYGCNRFFMCREGVIDEYESYNISRAQEEIWIKEQLLLCKNQYTQDFGFLNYAKSIDYVILLRNKEEALGLIDLLILTKEKTDQEQFNRCFDLFAQEIERLDKYGIDSKAIINEAKKRCGTSCNGLRGS